MFWDRSPDQRENVRQLVNEGRLRLTSSGVTTADTLLPSTEAILRDLLIGQEWLRANGMTPEPGVAYFADSFGCTPALPSILRAAGFDRTAITRVDGMYFPGCDPELPGRFPKAGSSAEMLLERERSLDFIWRDRAGAEVLCHWNAFTYGHGDMLAHAGITRIYLAKLAVPMRTNGHIKRRINRYAKQLVPYSRTPYMLCPIGFDFVEPIPDLVALLDRYNRRHYPKTGVWAVNAGLDDYLSLVEHYRERLPVIELDPNPYWTGFYTARPTLKQRSRGLVDNLLDAEKLSYLPDNRGAKKTISMDLEHPWWQAVVSNHHDYITGTSPDSVAEDEQIPWLDQALSAVKAVAGGLAPAAGQTPSAASSSGDNIWTREKSTIRIDTKFYQASMSEEAGWGIAELKLPDLEVPLLRGVSNDLVSYRDSGGLWRMGCEFAGGTWKESSVASTRSVSMQMLEYKTGVQIKSEVELDGETITRRMWFDRETPTVRCRVEGIAAEGHSIAVRLATAISATKMNMSTPGGFVTRPSGRIYNPTFWPLYSFTHLQDDETGQGIAVVQPNPGAVSFSPDGRIELIAMRNAVRETAFGLLKLPANPASGHERESYAYEYSLIFTRGEDWRENNLHRYCIRSPALTEAIITTDNTDVWVTAIKPASRGEGIIIRLNCLWIPVSDVRVAARDLKVTNAVLCDARERDQHPLALEDGAARVPITGTITTVRLITE